MIFDVYVMVGGEDGRYDPVDALAAGPKRGELIIRRRYARSSDKVLMAELKQPGTDKDLLTALQYVHLVAIDGKGMMIEGTQTFFERESAKARRHFFTQRWLVKLPGHPAILDTEKLLKRSAARLNGRHLSGFSKEDDDRID